MSSRKSFWNWFGLAVFFISNVPFVAAQNYQHSSGSVGPSRRAGFSQLEFDKTVPKPKTTSSGELTIDDIRTNPNLLINEPAVTNNIQSGEKIPQSGVVPANKTGATAEKTNLLEMTGYLPPNLKGPQLEADGATVLSGIGWTELKGTGCLQAQNTQQLCNKAKSLRDLLFRFSGNNDFFDSHCADQCPGKNDVGKLVSFTIADETRGALRYEGRNNQCVFALKKPPRSKEWMMIPVSEVNCACVPATCM